MTGLIRLSPLAIVSTRETLEISQWLGKNTVQSTVKMKLLDNTDRCAGSLDIAETMFKMALSTIQSDNNFLRVVAVNLFFMLWIRIKDWIFTCILTKCVFPQCSKYYCTTLSDKQISLITCEKAKFFFLNSVALKLQFIHFVD